MFQNCTIQMLMDQQNIIRKQRETIEKKKTSPHKVKTKRYKNNRTRKKQKHLNKLKKPKKSFKILCPLCKDKTFDLNNPTYYNRHYKKCKVVQEKKKAKEEKKIEKQKVKMYIFF